ncbi:hypothetical protein BDW74DRAFT_166432 [Aspergillus multicolor]|uniref:uncharacterized protein n=1 Tax=Aspergillus multicolor TaxID=41759 RepID=UPI003CCDEBD9
MLSGTQRAQRRSTKCDYKFPQCTPCALANAACLGYDPLIKQAVPRSLVKSLEARAAQLEAQLLALQAAPGSVPLTMATTIGQATNAFGIPRQGPYLGSKPSSGSFLRPSCPPLAVSPPTPEMTVKSVEQPPNGRSQYQQSQFYRSSAIRLESVPRSALDRMVSNYADTHLPQYPIMPVSFIQDILQRIPDEEQTETTPRLATNISGRMRLGHFEYFAIFIALAISASTLTWRAETQARQASESFYRSAIEHLRLLDDYSALQELQISLLLAHYAHMCPEMVDNWTCISNAVRIVISLGLYLEAPVGLPENQARLRNQLFWVTYGMERSLCTNLRLPLSFPEEVIKIKLMDPIPGADSPRLILDDLKRSSSASHIYRYRMLETEVHRVLYLQEGLLKFGFSTLEDWTGDLIQRLEIWYEQAHTYTAYDMLEFKHVQFYHLRARVFRPTPRLRTTSPEAWATVLESSRNLIGDYTDQEHRRRLFYPWHGVHILFETAIIALDASWSARYHPHLHAEAQEMLHTYLPQCLQLLVAIGKRWSQATECANMLRLLLDGVSFAFSQPPNTHQDTSQTRYEAGGFELNADHLSFDDMLTDSTGFLAWAPDWDILPAEVDR